MAKRTYAETVDYLYGLLPDAQRHGMPKAKVDLRKTLVLLEALGNPHHRLRVAHVAGTNGKGTVSHLLASFGTASGLVTGLYTSPHYVDFRERIRVDGRPVPEAWVIDFTEANEEAIEQTGASFFEFTVAMAFAYFSARQVDLAVVEVGLGGRLDSTNVVPASTLLCAVITNIGFDHTEVLGDTLAAIAREKAGIIKLGRPVVLGSSTDETRAVFQQIAGERHAPLVEAERAGNVHELDAHWRGVIGDLHGPFASENLRTAAVAWGIVAGQVGLSPLPPRAGVERLAELTGYAGRFQTLRERPLVVADAGHNPAAWERTGPYVASIAGGRPLLVVCGFVRGKDVASFFTSFPVDTVFFVTAPDLPRAIPAREVVATVTGRVRFASVEDSVREAYASALRAANPDDTVFVGGSSFVVGALLEHLGHSPR